MVISNFKPYYATYYIWTLYIDIFLPGGVVKLLKMYVSMFLFRITDNLPCATKFELLETGESQYEHGYKLGFVKDGKVSI